MDLIAIGIIAAVVVASLIGVWLLDRRRSQQVYTQEPGMASREDLEATDRKTREEAERAARRKRTELGGIA